MNNLRVYAVSDEKNEEFPLWQTPVSVADYILSQPDPAQTYLDWVLRIKTQSEEMGYGYYSGESSHENELVQWIDEHRDWEIRWEMVGG